MCPNGWVRRRVLVATPVVDEFLISDEVVDLFQPVRFLWVRRGRWP